MTETRVLIAGVSTRAVAESAASAGFAVTAIDAFADADQHPAVRALALAGAFTPRRAVEAVVDVECDAVTYLSPFENHPDAVRSLAAGRTLWGNPPDVLRRVRDPAVLANTLRGCGFAAPRVRQSADLDEPFDNQRESSSQWLVKPTASGGGHGIRFWDGEAVSQRRFLQEFVKGIPGSVVFAAAGGRASLLGIFRQLIGDPAFGASGFQYCGNILAAGDEPYNDVFRKAVHDLAGAVAGRFGLVGVNGIDFVARDGIPYPTEVNPRWCASMELVERAYRVSVYGAHAGACAGELPDFDLARAHRGASLALGKAIVFAKHDIVVGDVDRWQGDTSEDGGLLVRDVPRAGARITAGRPICTIFAAAPDSASCHAALVRRAGRVYADVAR